MEEKLTAIVERFKNGKSTLVGVLQDVSQAFGYLPEETLRDISAATQVPVSLFYSLATFYKSFRLEPIGKKHICVCVGRPATCAARPRWWTSWSGSWRSRPARPPRRQLHPGDRELPRGLRPGAPGHRQRGIPQQADQKGR